MRHKYHVHHRQNRFTQVLANEDMETEVVTAGKDTYLRFIPGDRIVHGIVPPLTVTRLEVIPDGSFWADRPPVIDGFVFDADVAAGDVYVFTIEPDREVAEGEHAARYLVTDHLVRKGRGSVILTKADLTLAHKEVPKGFPKSLFGIEVPNDFHQPGEIVVVSLKKEA